jgi:[acyl-carrier-protein] S-malonyltransferase
MSKLAFVFPGQGAQKVGMGKDFYEAYASAREVFDQASAWLELDMCALCFEENDKLDRTEYTQAALVTTCLAMERVIREAGIHPDVTAGLSLGEYCAISAADGMSRKDAITTVRTRGILMEHAVPFGQGSMAAVIGLDGATVEAVTDPIEGVSVANYNCPGQIVITGWKDAVEQAAGELKEAGARRVLPLKVSGPFHSPMMKAAAEELAETLGKVELTPLQLPYVTNVTGTIVTDHEQIRGLLQQQIASSVRWQQSIETMIADGTDTFIEIGPGKTLAGFIRKINSDVQVFNIQTVDDFQTVKEQLSAV